jgi:hypothetical protein
MAPGLRDFRSEGGGLASAIHTRSSPAKCQVASPEPPPSGRALSAQRRRGSPRLSAIHLGPERLTAARFSRKAGGASLPPSTRVKCQDVSSPPLRGCAVPGAVIAARFGFWRGRGQCPTFEGTAQDSRDAAPPVHWVLGTALGLRSFRAKGGLASAFRHPPSWPSPVPEPIMAALFGVLEGEGRSADFRPYDSRVPHLPAEEEGARLAFRLSTVWSCAASESIGLLYLGGAEPECQGRLRLRPGNRIGLSGFREKEEGLASPFGWPPS